MTVPVVAFDESGNSRGNLLDPDQPIAVVASVLLTEEEAQDCLARLRAVTKQDPTTEIKFSGLKSPRSREGVEALLRSDVLTPETVRAALAYKPFTAVCKLVDLTVEPMLHEGGVDLYKNGAALATSNLLYTTAPDHSDRGKWANVLDAFNRACARPQAAEFQAFEQAVDAWGATAGSMGYWATMLPLAARYLPDALLAQDGNPLNDPLDPALPLFVELARSWGDSLEQDFAVLHDHSEVMERWMEVLYRLDEFPDPVRPGQNLARLRIAPGQLVADADSKEHARLQVADVVVGAVRAWAVAEATGRPLQDASARFRDLTHPWVVRLVAASLDGYPWVTA
ncbi:DUF3800 domain-containing protein [Modestobacter sp. Leaf380]|uniref:DUF3800 domain-containing protein n=1 Tax=Modestobacter sp. Leaf380 TaxID=1736356 RepID=UPI0006FB9979|nr:DUF3800 domain-containing protein [Modestobacter sp. Leaf380]KQS71211.1 hypothetical protein ASG41_20990 [Modestobacter sp. Leaf380]